MFYGVPRLHFKDNHFFLNYVWSISYNRREQIERLNLDILTSFTFLVS